MESTVMLDLGTDLLYTVQDYRHCLSFTSKEKEARKYKLFVLG